MDSNMNKKQLIYWLITVIITLVIMLIPTSEAFTPVIRNFCAISVFFIVTLAFDILPAYVVGIALPMAYVLLKVCDYAVAFVGWSTSTAMLCFCAFIFANALDRIGLLKRVGLSLILKFQGSFDKTMWALFLAGVIITFMTFSNSPVLIFALAYAIYKSFDLKPTDREAVVVVLTAALGGCTSNVYCYNALTLSILSSSASSMIEGFSLPWYEILLKNSPMFLFSALFLFLMLKWAKGSKTSRVLDGAASKAYCEQEYAALGEMKPVEKKGLVVLVLLMIYLFSQPFHHLDLAYGFMLGSAILYLPGINVGEMRDIAKVPWGTMFLVLAFLGIGAAANATGFTMILSQFLAPLISRSGVTGSVYVSYIFGTVSNLILSPFAMVSMLPVPIAQYCTNLGVSPIPHLLALLLSTDTIFLPYEWPAYMILFSFSMIKMNTMIKAISIKAIIEILFVCVVIIPLWSVFGVI